MKEFLKSQKKTAILGLIGSIGMLLYFISVIESIWSLVTNLYIIGFIVYFIIILMRLYLQKGSVKVANCVLVISHIVSLTVLLVTIIPDMQEILTVTGIIYIIVTIITILYFCNLFLKKPKIINNKVFAIILILFVGYHLINIAKSINGFLAYRYPAEFEISAWAMLYVGYLLILPYFYGYYELTKGKN